MILSESENTIRFFFAKIYANMQCKNIRKYNMWKNTFLDILRRLSFSCSSRICIVGTVRHLKHFQLTSFSRSRRTSRAAATKRMRRTCVARVACCDCLPSTARTLCAKQLTRTSSARSTRTSLKSVLPISVRLWAAQSGEWVGLNRSLHLSFAGFCNLGPK